MNGAAPAGAQLNMPSGQHADRYILFALLNTLVNRIQAAADAQFREVTWKQWFALLGVSVFRQPPGIQEVASLIGTSHQNLKQLLNRLQRAGLVRLEKDPADQRRTLVIKTDASEAFEKKYRAESNAFMRAIYDAIAEEDITVTRRTIQQMEHNLRSFAGRGKEET